MGMGLPSVDIKTTNGNLGIVPDSPTKIQLKIGTATGGPENLLVFPASKSDLVSNFISGPLVEAAAVAMDYPNRGPVACMRVHSSINGTIGTVSKTYANPVGIPTTIGTGDASIIATAKKANESIKFIQGSGNNTPLSHKMTGGDVEFTLSTDGAGAANTTPNTLISYLNLSAQAALRDAMTVVAGGNGNSVIQPASKTTLPYGSNGIISTSGNPLDAYQTRINMTRTTAFRYSLDGGDVFSDEYAVPTGGTFEIPGTGITVAFSSTFDVGDGFAFDCVAPSYTNGDLANTLDALLRDPREVGFAHVIGSINPTIFASLAVYVSAFENARKRISFVCEATPPSVGQTNAQWSASLITAYQNSFCPSIGVCPGEGEVATSLSTPQPGRTMKRNLAWTLSARRGAISISRDIGDVSDGPLYGLVDLYQEEQAAVLAQARFSVAYRIPGRPGFYGEGRLMDSPTGDFEFWQHIDVLNEGKRVAYLELTNFLSSGVRVRLKETSPYPAGSIDPASAFAIEQRVNASLREALITPGHCTTALCIIDRYINMISQKKLKARIVIVPLGYLKHIEGEIGLFNPALLLE